MQMEKCQHCANDVSLLCDQYSHFCLVVVSLDDNLRGIRVSLLGFYYHVSLFFFPVSLTSMFLTDIDVHTTLYLLGSHPGHIVFPNALPVANPICPFS